MNYAERDEQLNNPVFRNRCRIALCDWLNYWVNNGVSSIQEEQLRENTKHFCQAALGNLNHYADKIAYLVISQTNIVNTDSFSDLDIKNAVVEIMSRGIEFLL